MRTITIEVPIYPTGTKELTISIPDGSLYGFHKEGRFYYFTHHLTGLGIGLPYGVHITKKQDAINFCLFLDSLNVKVIKTNRYPFLESSNRNVPQDIHLWCMDNRLAMKCDQYLTL